MALTMAIWFPLAISNHGSMERNLWVVWDGVITKPGQK